MDYIIIILSIAVAILVWQSIASFLRQRDARNQQAGVNQVVTHIFNQIKTTGKIELILDGKKMVVGEKFGKK